MADYANCTDCCDAGQQTNCCPDPLPSGLTATISCATCAAIDGLVIPLTYSVPNVRWEGSVVSGGVTYTVYQADATLMGSPYCPVQLDCDGVAFIGPTSDGNLTCSPAFSHSATGTFSDGCGCTGSHTAAIYVTE